MTLTLYGADEAAYVDACDEILVALALLNHRFTWTGEHLAIQPIYLPTGIVAGRDVWVPSCGVLAFGYLKIYENHWNALLVTEFASWLSRRLPTCPVKLTDSGGTYVLDEEVLLCEGAPYANTPLVLALADAFDAEGRPDGATDLREAAARARREEYYARVPAADYADVPEIRALGIPPEQIERMTLQEVAARFRFPWVTEGLGGA